MHTRLVVEANDVRGGRLGKVCSEERTRRTQAHRLVRLPPRLQLLPVGRQYCPKTSTLHLVRLRGR